jgi:hypothetical protein
MLESSNETVELETKLHIQFSFFKKKTILLSAEIDKNECRRRRLDR